MVAPEHQSLAKVLTHILGASGRLTGDRSGLTGLKSLVQSLDAGLSSSAKKTLRSMIEAPEDMGQAERLRTMLERALARDPDLARQVSEEAEIVMNEFSVAGISISPESVAIADVIDDYPLRVTLEGDPTTDPPLPGDEASSSSKTEGR